jgi:hypothetical protein
MKRYINLRFQSANNQEENYNTMQGDILRFADCALSLSIFAAFQINAKHNDRLILKTEDGNYHLTMIEEI